MNFYVLQKNTKEKQEEDIATMKQLMNALEDLDTSTVSSKKTNLFS